MSTLDLFVRRLLPLFGVSLCATGCLESRWAVCADGRVCESGRVCDEINHTCSSPEEPCLRAVDGMPCGGSSRVCLGGSCTDTCGDGDFDESREVCDPTDPASPTGLSCIEFGFDAGREGCAGDCASLTRDPCMYLGWSTEDFLTLPEGSIQDLWGAGDELLVLTSSQGVLSGARSWTDVGVPGQLIGGRALWASSPDDIWVIDSTGDRFQHWDGSTWTPTLSPAGGLNEIWGSSAADVFAVGNRGNVVHYDGRRWLRQDTPPTQRALRTVWGVAPNQVYAAGDGGFLIRYDGERWSEMDSGTGEALTGLWAHSSQEVWTAGPAGVRRFDGTRWISMSAADREPGARAWIAGTGPSDIWLSAGSEGDVRRYDGLRWSTLLAGDSGGPHPLWVDRNAVAVGFTGPFGDTVSRWYGAGEGPALETHGLWTDAWSSRSGEWIAIGTSQAGAPSALHSDGTIVPFEEPLVDLAGLRPDLAYAAGSSGTIYVWNGSEWSVSLSSSDASRAAVWASAPADVYASIQGAQGPARVLHLEGDRWTELPAVEPPCSGDVTTGWASGPDDLFVIGLNDLARFDGAKWTCYHDGQADRIFTSIWGSGRGDVWIAEAGLDDLGRLNHWDGTRVSHRADADWIAGGGGSRGGLIGTAADDVFFGRVAHFDGRVWSPIDYAGAAGTPVFALPSQLLIGGATEGVPGLGQFIRTRFWNQRPREAGCGDGVDDDDDGATDQDDTDCAGARESSSRPPR